MQIIDGKKTSEKIKNDLKLEVRKLKEKNIIPTLAVIMVGDNQASKTYVSFKQKACKECEMNSICKILDENTSEFELLKIIEEFNNDKNIDGILVQLPLPKHINTAKILKSIDPKKDVDGFHPQNIAKLILNEKDGFVPCTPLGIMELFKEYKINLQGKRACVIGRSNIVGKPMFNLLLNANATPTILHSKSENLKEITKECDIIIVAIGQAKFLKEDMIKDGAVVVDVGINKDENLKLVGDVDFENVSKKCSFITPVPGGVGPMTIAMLLKNTIKSAKNSRGKDE